jgi:hypothetical protein
MDACAALHTHEIRAHASLGLLRLCVTIFVRICTQLLLSAHAPRLRRCVLLLRHGQICCNEIVLASATKYEIAISFDVGG